MIVFILIYFLNLLLVQSSQSFKKLKIPQTFMFYVLFGHQKELLKALKQNLFLI